jgi:hypothetical protein
MAGNPAMKPVDVTSRRVEYASWSISARRVSS